jgi:hypothetical protein
VRQPEDGSPNADIPKERLLQIVKQLLNCDLDLDFLLQLEKKDLAQLVAAIRGGMDRGKR